jgi:hypothetical protein
MSATINKISDTFRFIKVASELKRGTVTRKKNKNLKKRRLNVKFHRVRSNPTLKASRNEITTIGELLNYAEAYRIALFKDSYGQLWKLQKVKKL